jgi:hypothetical protein
MDVKDTPQNEFPVFDSADATFAHCLGVLKEELPGKALTFTTVNYVTPDTLQAVNHSNILMALSAKRIKVRDVVRDALRRVIDSRLPPFTDEQLLRSESVYREAQLAFAGENNPFVRVILERFYPQFPQTKFLFER